MTAIEALLAGLFDYAGLYPPASLGLRSAANNYIEYSRGKHAAFLGRFIINAERLDELRTVAGDALGQFRISAIVADAGGLDTVADEIRKGMPIGTIEIKCAPEDIAQIAPQIPKELTAYFEVAANAGGLRALRSILGTGARAKIRMGGVVPEAIPSAFDAAEMVGTLAQLPLAFKATAGLHHPVRSRRALTYQPQSPSGTMHGFMNLCCAAAVGYFGGNSTDAENLLQEENTSAWQVGADAIQWRDLTWTTGQLATLRRDFFQSIGSCSFEEPMHDLESLGWL